MLDKTVDGCLEAVVGRVFEARVQTANEAFWPSMIKREGIVSDGGGSGGIRFTPTEL